MFPKVSRRSCAITSCTNSWYKLEQWMKNICSIHKCNFGTASCDCIPPFRLFPFPTQNKDPTGRMKWASLVNRKNGNVNWTPTNESRICSKHFVDGEPTLANPYPTLELGYTLFEGTKKARPPPSARSMNCVVPSKKSKIQFENGTEIIPVPDIATTMSDHDYIVHCNSCNEKSNEIQSLKEKIRQLTNEVNFYKKKFKTKTHKQILISDVMRSDKKCKFYTGFPTVDSFETIYKIMDEKAKEMHYWKGPKRVCNPLNHKKVCNVNHERRLTRKEECILTLMKLRLGLLLEDLADRFGISTTHASHIFTTWVKIISKTLGALVFNPPKEIVKSNLPPSFKNSKYKNVRHIIDCTEVFLEKPNNPEVALKTYSDYKHHHTAKYLVSINPSGLINFVSDGFGGRFSDKYITHHSGYLDIVEPYDSVMADKGFTIREELALIGAELFIPPGRRGACQMSTSDVRLTKDIANRRIHIEQAIRRMKCFRFLKYEVPLTLAHLLDDCVRGICGICNLYPPIPKYDK